MVATLLLATLAATSLDAPDLQFMVQEEKMARDVYSVFADQHGLRLFSNIAKSEQQHMDAVAALLNSANLSNPTEGLGAGQFKNPEIDKMYKQLVESGRKSLMNALIAGATIEDKDISDLDALAKEGAKGQVMTTVKSLRSASEIHLRVFYGQIKRRGGTYAPQFISQAEFDRIINR